MGRLLAAAAPSIAPPPRLTPSEWAERRFYLSPESSSEPGRINFDRAPYQRAMLDAIIDPTVEDVVVMSSSQVGKTTIELAMIGFLIDLQPCPIMFMCPTLEMAEATSKDRIAPMLRDSPCFAEKIKSPQSRNSGNTLLHKALDVDTPIATPMGWKKMADIEVGDMVFDENGIPCNVTYVTPINYGRKCYKVVFSDGATIIADEEHPWYVERWKVDKTGDKPKQTIVSELLSTKELINGIGGKRSKYSIPVSKPLITSPMNLPIDPYILGAWIGDGASHAAVIHSGLEDADEMSQILKSCGAYGEFRSYFSGTKTIKLDPPYGQEKYCVRGHDREANRLPDGHCAECHRQFVNLKSPNRSMDPIVPNSIRTHLERMGLLKSKYSSQSLKFIPPEYLRASFEQRVALLQGIMDTDGHITNKGHCKFSTTLKVVSDGVSELLTTLGIQHNVSSVYPTYCYKGEKKIGKQAFTICFTPPSDFDVFRLTRKLKRQKEFIANQKVKRRAIERRQIVDVVPVDSVPVRCISVDSPSHLYLAGTAMIPTHNTFPGGQLVLVGANSPASLASRPIRAILGDELDRFPESAGTEGDPVNLARKRSATFWNKLHIWVSTPTVKDKSRIEKLWLLSDKRHYLVPCPHCGHRQALAWDGLQYENKGKIDLTRGDVGEVTYRCSGCGRDIDENRKFDMLAAGQWEASGRAGKIAGFHLNELYSPWKPWQDVARDFEAAQGDPLRLQVFWNTSLGLPFEHDGATKFDWENLQYRSEASDYQMGQLPNGVFLLTAGVDIQGDRLECSIFGWGEGEQCWLIRHEVLFGDPLDNGVWEDLDFLLQYDFSHPLGGTLRVRKTAIDSGYLAQEVYRRSRGRKDWMVIKGVAGDRKMVGAGTWQEINWQNKPIKRGIKVHSLGVDLLKQTILGRCRVAAPGPKYLNLPNNLPPKYCQELAGSEVMIKKKVNASWKYVWEPVPGVRNEPLDCAVYAYAAAIFLGLPRFNANHWDKIRQSITNETGQPMEPETPKPESPPPPEPPKRRKPVRRINNYLNGFGRGF